MTRSQNHHQRKPVIMRDPKTKEIVRRFNSMVEAAEHMDGQYLRLLHAIRSKTIWEGYLWEQAPKENKNEDKPYGRP